MSPNLVQTTCHNCGHTSARSAEEECIYLETQRYKSVQDCFNRFSCLDVEEGVNCDGCLGKHDRAAYSSIKTLPAVLVVKLVRVKHGDSDKVQDKVRYFLFQASKSVLFPVCSH